MITSYKKYIINESLTNFDISNLFTIISVVKDNDGNWIYKDIRGKEFFLAKDQVGKITIINDNISNYINNNHPIIKYIETDNDNNIIYIAEFIINIVALNQGRVYLINKEDNNKDWCIPEGYIKPGENFQNAAIRILNEETLIKNEDILNIEYIDMIKINSKSDINVYSYSFLFKIKDYPEEKFSYKNIKSKWYLINRASRNKLKFEHHNKILNKVYF